MDRKFSRRLALVATGAAGLAAFGYVATRSRQPSIVEITADYPYFANLDDIAAAADAVVVAQYLSSHEELMLPDARGGDLPKDPQRGITLSEEQRRDMGVPSTISVMRVSRVLKGSLKPGEQIKVTQLGGTVDGTRFRESSTPLLGKFAEKVPNKTFLLTLKKYGDVYDAINPTMGIHGVDPQGGLLTLDARDGAVLAATSGTRRLTVEDLEQP